jgi:hypothetical protein
MLDTPEELARWPALAEPLRQCESAIGPAFRAADAAALKHQKNHRRLARLAAGCGTAAVLFAIVQLAFPGLIRGHLLVFAEVLAVTAAAAAVILGLVSSRLPNWLVERHKAELFRLAKFRFLIDPALWTGDQEGQRRRAEALRADVQRITALTAASLKEEIEKETPPDHPPEARAAGAVDERTLEVLVDYYRAKRLLFQRDFFRRCIASNERWDLLTRYLPPALFFGSVIAVLVHFGLDLLPVGEHLEGFTRVLICLAAALPALAGGVRTLRTAYEFARNSSRYRAKEFALSRLDAILRSETERWSKVRELWYSEEILEFERREWCRLMMESEWFG